MQDEQDYTKPTRINSTSNKQKTRSDDKRIRRVERKERFNSHFIRNMRPEDILVMDEIDGNG